MARIDHKQCYGTMFPNPLRATNDAVNAGKAFSFVVISPGGMCRAVRRVEVNREEWDDCTQCPEFEDCYRLGMAKLALEAAVSNI
jgi:hypothetical protein